MLTYRQLQSKTQAHSCHIRGFQLHKNKRKRGQVNCAQFHGIPFYFRASETPPAGTGQVVIDMENVSFDEASSSYKSFGRVYCTLSAPQLLAFMCSLSPFDSHLYESMSSSHAHKLVIDIDRCIRGCSCSIASLDGVLQRAFIPFLITFLTHTLTHEGGGHISIHERDILLLDASEADVKYSKHIIVNTRPYLCAPSRAHEQQLMRLFERKLAVACSSDAVLSSFCYFEENAGESKCAVDFSIYTSGKRSMRTIGSCKGNNKRAGALRTLTPDGSWYAIEHQNLPFIEYFANTFGAAHVLWDSKVPLLIQPARIRQHKHIHTPQRTAHTPQGAAESATLKLLEAVAARVHPSYVSCSTSLLEEGGEVKMQCNINYAAGADGSRRCAFFNVQHNRHYAALTLGMAGRLEYYCHGCRDGVVLCEDLGAASTHTCKGTRDFRSLCGEMFSQATYTQVDARYLPPLSGLRCGSGLLLVKSSMGTGKTKVVADHISAMHHSCRVLSVGFRQTLNSSLAERFGLQDYQTATQPLHDYGRLSVQYDSIIKLLQPTATGGYRLKAMYDLVVVDEVESLLAHMLSDTIKSRCSTCWKVFRCILDHSKDIMLCDADIGAPTLELASRIAAGRSTVIAHNVFNASKRDFVFMASSKMFMSMFSLLCVNGRAVYVACNSKKYASLLSKRATSLGRRVLLIQGSSPVALKRDMANCNVLWKAYDTVICTPAVAAGVDFSEVHFDNTMVYGTSCSNTARELNQQIGRVRKTKENKVFVYIEDPTHRTEPAVESSTGVFMSISSIIEHHALHMSSTICAITGDVSVRMSKCSDDLAKLLCMASDEKHRSRVCMQGELVRVLTEAGAASVTQIPKKQPRYMDTLQLQLGMVKMEIDWAATLAPLPLIPADDMNTTIDAALHEKAALCHYYGSANFTSPEMILALSQPRQMIHSNTVHELLLTTRQLYTIESSSGMQMHRTSFVDGGGVLHTSAHGLVLELQQPMWSRKLFVIVLLYAAGCAGVKVNFDCGVLSACDDDTTLWALAETGLNAALSAERMDQSDWICGWIEQQSKLHRVHVCVTGSRALIKDVKRYMTLTYGLRWQTKKKQRNGIRSRISTPQANHTAVLVRAACLRLYNTSSRSPLVHACVDREHITSIANSIVTALDDSLGVDATADMEATLKLLCECDFSYAARDLQARASKISRLKLAMNVGGEPATTHIDTHSSTPGWDQVAAASSHIFDDAAAAVDAASPC